jgi:hypothetical protein
MPLISAGIIGVDHKYNSGPAEAELYRLHFTLCMQTEWSQFVSNLVPLKSLQAPNIEVILLFGKSG